MTDLTGTGKTPMGEMGLPFYTRKQTGNVMTIIVFTGLACIIYLMSQRGVQKVLVFYTVALGVLAIMFSSMTVTVGSGMLTVKFGLGLVRKKFKLADMESVRAVRNPWHYGWGIRRIPGGWFFGVAGQSAVEIIMKSGKRFRIGSANPEELKSAISEFSGGLL